MWSSGKSQSEMHPSKCRQYGIQLAVIMVKLISKNNQFFFSKLVLQNMHIVLFRTVGNPPDGLSKMCKRNVNSRLMYVDDKHVRSIVSTYGKKTVRSFKYVEQCISLDDSN